MAFTFKVPLARKTLTGCETLLFCARNGFSLPHDLAGAILFADIIEGCKEQIPVLHGHCYPTFDTFLSDSDWYLGAIEDLGYMDIVQDYNRVNDAVYELVRNEYSQENDDALISKIIGLIPDKYIEFIKRREDEEIKARPILKGADTRYFNVEDVIDKRILESLFPKDSDNDIIKRGYAIEKNLPQNTVLFLGLNPSYDIRKPVGQKECSDFYVHELTGPLHRHFKREKDLIEHFYSCGLDYESKYFPHHDLLCMREQQSEVVIDMCKKNVDFFEKQIYLSKQVIEAASPAIIVAENSELRRIIFEEKKVFEFAYWDPQLGVDFFFIENKPTPILFTGMISALNNGSYYSLRWHIQHILEQIR